MQSVSARIATRRPSSAATTPSRTIDRAWAAASSGSWIKARGSERGTFSEFSTTLDVVEPMGTETMVFFKLGGEAVSGRIDSGMSTPASGEKVRLVANMMHMHLIDPQTDAVI